MFKRIINIWRNKRPLQSMMSEFESMLVDAEWMFVNAKDVFTARLQPEIIRDELYMRDIKINKNERLIRRQIVTHLSVNPEMDIPSCLVLMSIVKDAERIGDYCKNIFQVAEKFKFGKQVFKDKYFEEINAIGEEIKVNFQRTKEAFAEENEEKALKSIGASIQIGKKCDAIINSILDDRLNCNKGVVYALIARYFKRVDGHLSNISTSVVSPIENLDFSRKIQNKISEEN
ncbi:hypothetical protein M0R36_07405 [bacterium]|jgi:phosphate uptake regulator|nr:hypothetical protein [bacterium]